MVAAVARRSHHDHPQGSCIVGCHRRGVRRQTERRTEGQVDDIDAVGKIAVAVGVDGPFQRQVDQIRAARTAEDLERIDLGQRCHPRADAQLAEVDVPVPRAGVGLALCGDPVAGCNAGHMGAVAVTILRVWVGCRDRAVGWRTRVGVVKLAGKIIAADNFGAGKAGYIPDDRPVVFGIADAGPAKVQMEIVDPGIDDSDANAFSPQTGKPSPDLGDGQKGDAGSCRWLLAEEGVDGFDAGQAGERASLLWGGQDSHPVGNPLGAIDQGHTLLLEGVEQELLRLFEVGQIALGAGACCRHPLLSQQQKMLYGRGSGELQQIGRGGLCLVGRLPASRLGRNSQHGQQHGQQKRAKS